MSDQTRHAMLTKANLIQQKLEEIYPVAPKGFLDYSDPFSLLVGVLLSAQSMDVKVNEVTPELFRLAPTPDQMIDLGAEKIQQIIKTVGLSKQKAKNIVKLSQMLCDHFNGQVPDTFQGLEQLPGVGHKTASVVMIQAFGKPAFPVDTHVHRLACRWGCGDAKSVEKTEAIMKIWFPDESSWADLHTRLILFGRQHCPARKHDMDACPICSFAATEEARNSNAAHPLKFVAPPTPKHPYSIRQAATVDSRTAKDDGRAPSDVEDGKSANVTRRKTRTQSKSTSPATPRKSTRNAKIIKGSYIEDDDEEPDRKVKVSRRKSARKTKTSDDSYSEEEEEYDDYEDETDWSDVSLKKNLPKRKSSRNANVIKGSYVEEEDDDEELEMELTDEDVKKQVTKKRGRATAKVRAEASKKQKMTLNEGATRISRSSESVEYKE